MRKLDYAFWATITAAGIVIISTFVVSFYLDHLGEFPLKGTYQGELFSPANGLYNISFNDALQINFYSPVTGEHFSGIATRMNKNKYNLDFGSFQAFGELTAKKELQLSMHGQNYLFLKKENFPIWEAGYEPIWAKEKGM